MRTKGLALIIPFLGTTSITLTMEGFLALSSPAVLPSAQQVFCGFQGERYVRGIGSDTRDSLHHLHSRQKVVMVTTCKNLREMMDERYQKDNLYYRLVYENLLAN